MIEQKDILLWLAIGAIATTAISALRRKLRTRRWASLQRAHLLERKASIEKAKQFVAEKQPTDAMIAEISALSATKLGKLIGEGKYKAVDVLRVYYLMAFRAHEKTNCLTEILIDRAVQDAKAADEFLAKNKKPIGPLHGVPVSVKENKNLKGAKTTMGCVVRSAEPAKDVDAIVVDSLVQAGAIPFVKTNIPQTMLSFECDNPLFGRGLNPYSKDHTCGGSSGGEAALLALQGSPCGVGSDIGGSCRIPATFCGVYGLKPGLGRISNIGATPSTPGQEGIPGVIGFLTRNIEDMVTLTRIHVESEPWRKDPNCLPLLWNDAALKTYSTKKLVVGYYENDGFLEASPANARAVREAVAALERAGHKVVKFDPPNVMEGMQIFYQCLSADGAKTVKGLLKGEPLAGEVSKMLFKVTLPRVLKMLSARILNIIGETKFASIMAHLAQTDVAGLYKTVYRRNLYRTQFLQQFEAAGIDVLIAPGFTLPATPHNTFSDVSFAVAATGLYNVLDFSAIAVPVTTLNTRVDGPMTAKKDAPIPMVYKKAAAVYERCRVDGLPLGVQVIAPRCQEERILGAATQLAKALGQQ